MNVLASSRIRKGVTRFVTGSIVGVATVMTACSPPGASSPAPASPANTAPASESGLTSVTGVAPRGAFIVLEPTTLREWSVPETPVVMDQLGKQFIPAVLVARAGQPVEFRNSEDTPHNVYVKRYPTGREVLNVSTDPTQRYVHVFEESGQYDVSCDIHPGMFATVWVVSSPYAAIADEAGQFVILNVAPGAYRMKTEGKEIERTVNVGGPHTDVGRVGS